MAHRGPGALLLAAVAAFAGCASSQRGVTVGLGGSTCCLISYLEPDPDDPRDHGGAVAMFECLTVDLAHERYMHRDDCPCSESCPCHRIAADNDGARPRSNLRDLMGPRFDEP